MFIPKPSAMKAAVLSLGLIALVAMQACVQGPSKNSIGLFTSVQGQAVVIHADESEPIAIGSQNGVHSEDIIETKQGSRAKAWLQDDTLLSVGEESRVELSEHSYDPVRDRRSTVIRLTRGRVRALIGRPLANDRSKFEVHTATAIVAARGTYFIVWLEEGGSKFPPGTTGVVNIGHEGLVAFTSAMQTEIILPGQFSIALPDMPPTIPRDIALDPLHEASNAITGTEIKDNMTAEKPSEVVRAIGTGRATGLGIPESADASESDTDETPPAVISGAVSIARQLGGSPVSDGGDGGDTETPPTNPGPTPTPPAPSPIPGPITPPAIISGAVSGSGLPGGILLSGATGTGSPPTSPGSTPTIPAPIPIPGPVTSPPIAPIPVVPSAPSPTPTPVISPPSAPIPVLPAAPSPTPSPVISPPSAPIPVLPSIPSPITSPLR